MGKLKEQIEKQLLTEDIIDGKTAKKLKYKELEPMVQDVLDKKDFKKFKQIINDLYNWDREDLFVRMFVNYDTNGKLTKALFNAMK